MKFSLVIPVYNRPDEIRELLSSLSSQEDRDFEVIIVEDGSTVTCEEEVKGFASELDVRYFFKANSGPGLSRNFGAERSTGDYLIFLDSDVVVPSMYISSVRSHLESSWTDAFGGPDAAAASFTPIQKAVSYSMTSFFTTGGIRGGGEKLDKFYPRSFNMGYSREVFNATGGFSGMRYGEDIDMSIRILQSGFKTALFREAFVYHKRRTSLEAFFHQVYHSGEARIELQKRHPGSMKAVHLLPAAFTVGCALLLVLSLLWSRRWLSPLLIYALLLYIDCWQQTRSVKVALLSIITSYTQLIGYGCGFISAIMRRD